MRTGWWRGTILLLVGLTALPGAVGFHGDGSGVLAAGDPPREWSDDHNLRWRTPLPNWGNGQPVVAGDRAYVLCEPLTSVPLLVCIDVADGRICWQREIDHLDASTRQEAEALIADIQQANALQARHFAAVVHKDDSDRQAVLEEIAAGDFHSKKTKGAHIVVRPGDGKGYGRSLGDLRKRGVGLPFWCIGGHGDVHHPGYSSWEGVTYATPVADTTGVWTWVMPGVAAHFDREGTQRWLRFCDPFAEGGSPKGRWPDCKYTSSPVLVDGVLVTVGNDRIHGLDAETGAVLWQADMAHGQGWEPCPLLVITLPGGVTGVIGHDGVVYRPRDGRPLCEALPDPSDAGLLVHEDVVVLQRGKKQGRGVVAFRLQADSSEVWSAEQLWEADDWSLAGDHDNRVPICYDGLIYASGGIARLADGEQLVEGKKNKGFFHSHSSAWKIGELLFCHGPEDKTGRGGAVPPAVTRVCDPRTLDVLAINRLSPAPIEGAKREQLMHHSSRGALGWAPRGMQTIFATGDRLYIRSHDHLACVGGN